MKLRIAKKVVSRWNSTQMTSPNRRDLILKAHEKLGLPRPSFQEPEALPIERDVVNSGTLSPPTDNPDTPQAAISLTTLNKNLTDLRVPELKALCKDQEIKGYSKLNREGLIKVLQASE